jgi:hypothetical protein
VTGALSAVLIYNNYFRIDRHRNRITSGAVLTREFLLGYERPSREAEHLLAARGQKRSMHFIAPLFGVAH